MAPPNLDHACHPPPPELEDRLAALAEKVAHASNRRASDKALTGSTLGNLWRWRVGDDRVVADMQDRTVTVLVVRIGHLREVYR
jgi:mRNA interferase RelE/StbE